MDAKSELPQKDKWYVSFTVAVVTIVIPVVVLFRLVFFETADRAMLPPSVAGAAMAFLSYFVTCFVCIRFGSRGTFSAFGVFVGGSLISLTIALCAFTEIFRIVGLNTGGTEVRDPLTCFYFAVITWTTVGYGDVTPTAEARLYAAAESLMGYVFMGLGIAALTSIIASYKTNRPRRKDRRKKKRANASVRVS